MAHWVSGRIALAGDAAHCFVPTLAQGAAMGLEDAFVLAEVLTTRGSVPTALHAYETRRRNRVESVVEASHHLAEMLARGQQDQAPAVIGRTLSALVSAP
ncbi:FAD-dependent monooxygenase [Streptomyces sp.]|uniref:FAD-dependent monooxygenase n=1 Tax=Streptomyces sp. TaxID=1931 RepID=UPI002F402A2C